jgi:anti-sigma factor RsiW
MNVTREVIVDLLPVYLSGEASPATKELVESYMKQDPELAQLLRSQWVENLNKATPATLPPELELRAFRRTKSLIGWQKWLLGFAIFFTSISASFEISTTGMHVSEFHFLLQSAPVEMGICVALAAAFWTGYFFLRRRLRSTVA